VHERTHGEGACTPSTTSTDLAVVAQEVEGGLVTKRDVNDTVVSKGAHGGKCCALLTTSLGASADEQTSVLAPETALFPKQVSLVLRHQLRFYPLSTHLTAIACQCCPRRLSIARGSCRNEWGYP
jgi:hypothetical protein